MVFSGRTVRNSHRFEQEPTRNPPNSASSAPRQAAGGGDEATDGASPITEYLYPAIPAAARTKCMDRRRREPKTAAIHKHEKGRKLVEDDKESAEGGGAYHAWPCLLKASGLEPSFMDAIPADDQLLGPSPPPRRPPAAELRRGDDARAQPPRENSLRPWAAPLRSAPTPSSLLPVPVSQLVAPPPSPSRQNQKSSGMQQPSFWAGPRNLIQPPPETTNAGS